MIARGMGLVPIGLRRAVLPLPDVVVPVLVPMLAWRVRVRSLEAAVG